MAVEATDERAASAGAIDYSDCGMYSDYPAQN
jgi:hypothetical protein